jgi:hypothetical protein
MPTDIKRKALTFLLMAVVLTVLIAAALPQLELKPGISLPDWEAGRGDLPQDQLPAASISINTYFLAVLEIVLVLVVVYGSYMLLKGVHWKKILAPALLIAGLVMIVFYIFFLLAGVRIKIDPFTPEVLPADLNIPGEPLGHLPQGLIWLAWMGLAAGIILLGIWFIRRPPKYNQSGDLLGLEAERALRALRTGSSLNDVIVRCYIQMSQVLQKEQEIELEQTMTAREFEQLLETRGIPDAPVHQLTQLFEAARYGFRQLGQGDEQKAFECLNAILSFSRAREQPD